MGKILEKLVHTILKQIDESLGGMVEIDCETEAFWHCYGSFDIGTGEKVSGPLR